MRPLPTLIGLAFVAHATACATPAPEPVDLGELAAEHALDADELALFVQGYEEGYDDGLSRNAGVYAGTGHGNLPGARGDGWVLGHREAVEGRARRDAGELAAWLAGRGR